MRISDWSSDVCSSDLTGDRIGPVIRRRAVAKHFQLADSDGRNGCKVRALRTPNIGDVGQLYRRTAMPTLAIHQHKRLIRWQAAHAVRPCENRTVIAGEALDIKRRHLLAQDIGYVRRTLIEQFVDRKSK